MKLKNAPNLNKQPNAPFDDLIILAGNRAWNAWSKGNGTEWLFLCDILQHPYKQAPIVLDEYQLKIINRLKIAEPEQRYIKIAQFGDISEQEKTGICLNLAKHTQANSVQFINNLAEVVEDVSAYIQRLREDETASELATKIAPKEKASLDFKTEKPTQPEIAEAFLSWEEQPIRRDERLGKIYQYNGVYWQVLPENELMRKIMLFFNKHNYRKYTARSLKGMADLVSIVSGELPQPNKDLIGFENGVLNKKTGEFLAHNVNHYLRTIEPFKCSTKSKNTPYFDDWLEFVSSGDDSKRNAILAGFYMVLTNRHEWELFLEVTGVGGAGKSVFGQIASIINGSGNTAYISLQELEIDRKRSMLIGKSLAISPDQKPYKGSAEELKAITGRGLVTVKLLYIDNFDVKLDLVFMLVTNHPIEFSEKKGGIGRRRVIIPFDRAIPKEKKDVCFFDKVKLEVYGIVNKLLALFPNPETAREILEAYKEENKGKHIKRESNHLIDFVANFELREERKGALRLGSNRSCFLNRANIVENDALYSAYLFYCDCHGINPLNLLNFKSVLSDAFKEAGEKTPYSLKMYYGYPTTNAFWKDRQLSIRQWEG